MGPHMACAARGGFFVLMGVGMIYTPLTKKALDICYRAHAGQRDRSGAPYAFHPFHVAEQMDTEDEVCAALLHDVVEDSDISLDDLRAEGFPERIVHAVDLLTHDESVPYLDYVRGIRGNALAEKVKLADLDHNNDFTRLDMVTDADRRRRAEKYEPAYRILRGQVD